MASRRSTRLRFTVPLLLVAGVSFVPCAPSQLVAFGVAADSGQSSGAPVADLGVRLTRAFPHLRFERPVFLTHAGDGSGRLFVAEQAGVVRVFDARDDVQSSRVFLDLRDRVSRLGNEEGLLGLAFHPEFADNGIFFVHYSSSIDDPTTGRTAQSGVLSRFHVSVDDPDLAAVDSEEVLLVEPQPYRNHNGGTVAFGPDGYLYLSFGDGGSANDPHGNGQNKQTLLGAILRLDVDFRDPGLAYAIPPDNPFAHEGDDARPELWAIGLRNVWRFSFDRETGELWAADIGQNLWEEVDVVTAGGNYGWNRYEGLADFALNTRLASPATPPVSVYGRGEGISITGGFVYRGARFPELRGSYFYADYASGNLWRAVRAADGSVIATLAARTGRSVASFGEDAAGELYVLSFDGGLYHLELAEAPEDRFANWPTHLSEIGLFTSLADLQPAAGVQAYDVATPFWSDGADKARFFFLPEGQRLGYRSEGVFEVPVGTTLVKNFQGTQMGRPAMLETRLIRRTDAGFEAATYVWDAGAREATLATEGRQFELYGRGGAVSTWHAPSASECTLCHLESTGFVLGLTAAQLDLRGVDDGPSQLERWASRGIVELPKNFAEHRPTPSAVAREGESSLEARARDWLDVNCAMCHQPEGRGNASIDLRRSVPLAATGLIDSEPAQGSLGIENARLIAAGEPDRSILLHRVATLGDGRMPNVATHLVDREAVDLLRQWIESLDER